MTDIWERNKEPLEKLHAACLAIGGKPESLSANCHVSARKTVSSFVNVKMTQKVMLESPFGEVSEGTPDETTRMRVVSFWNSAATGPLLAYPHTCLESLPHRFALQMGEMLVYIAGVCSLYWQSESLQPPSSCSYEPWSTFIVPPIPLHFPLF